MNGTFSEQLGGVAGIFDQWGTCERTVVACALARRVPWPGLKLVQRAVEAALQQHVEDDRLERDANDETLLAGLLAPRSDDDEEEGVERLQQLLGLLPLLRADNERGKAVYVAAVPALVQRCVDAPRAAAPTPAPAPATDLCRQLLSYLLVHPALSQLEQRTLTQWLRYLENHISGNRNTESIWQQRIDPCLLPDTNIWGANNSFRRTIGKNVDFRGILDSTEHSYTDLLQESFSKNGRDVDISLEGEMANFEAAIGQPKSQRSNSLTPPSSGSMQMSSSAENLSDEPFVQKPRSFSLSSEHSLVQLRPLAGLFATTGSETRLDDLRCRNFADHPGMAGVAAWLKSLRLHKYVWLFSNLTYDQMMAMDEHYLEKLGVTKGARHKILVSIKKLSERGAVLEAVRAELAGAGAGAVPRALDRLRALLLSPMPPDSDLPPAIVAALDLASKCLNGIPGPALEADPEHVDPMSLHCWLVEKALHHEAFRRGELQEALRRLRHRLPPTQFFHHVGELPLLAHRHKPRWRSGAPCPRPGGRRFVPPPPRGKSHSYPPFPPAMWPPPPLRPAPRSAPRSPRPRPARSPHAPHAPHAPHDDYSGLDALCLQMTEQAIN